MPDILLMIQFPWRMLVIVTFCFSIIAGVNFSKIFELLQNRTKKDYSTVAKSITYIIIIILCCLYSLSFLTDLNYEYKDNKHYQEEEIIDPVNQVSRYSSFLEYWPQKAITSIDYVINRDNKVIIINGDAQIENENKENGILTFDISNAENDTYLELPYLFYKGYEVLYTPYNSSVTEKSPIEESEHGLVQIKVDSNISGNIKVSYHATLLHKICIAISAITITIYIIYLIVSYVINKKNKK